MSFLSRVFRSKDSNAAKKQAKQNAPEDTAPPKPQWTDPYLRTEVSPEEVQELLRGCTQELKSRDSNFARDAFTTFIPISVESDARTKIIFDFFDLLAAIAAHGKSNGLGGRKLSRYAGWWAFEHTDTGNGFEAAYKNWTTAADATSHLFFAYLRSSSPDSIRGINGISALPIALQSLVQATEYPPQTPTLLQVSTTKVVMIVDTVSPTPFALLRRAKNFEYRDSDRHLQEFANYDDPADALTDECQRVLKAISSTNQSSVSSSKTSTSLRDASWSRFEDVGFGASIDSDHDDDLEGSKTNGLLELRSTPLSRSPDLGRPTTPSWADFLSTGFTDENPIKSPAPLLLPPDKVLPPIASVRGQSSQSHKRTLDTESNLDPGELASITTLDLDDSFWWVWITSLSAEEPASRKAVFGRCTLLETTIAGAKWLILEEQVKGAAPEPDPGAYIAEKKRFFGFSTRRRLTRRKSSGKKSVPQETYKPKNSAGQGSKTSIGPDQHARIQAAAAALQKKHREQEEQRQKEAASERQSRTEDPDSKTNSVMTMQPNILSEASQAMKWASNYDKDATPAPSTPPQTETQAATPPVPPKDSPKPANDGAADAPVASAEPAAPQNNASERAETPEIEPKKSVDSEDSKKLKNKPVNTSIKSMFSTIKKKSDIPLKPTGADPSAVAAARAALESKVKSQDTLPPPKAPIAHRLSGIRKKPAPETPASTVEESKPASAALSQNVEPSASEPEHPAQQAPGSPAYSGPPRTRRDAEYDALSRIDTNEKAMADREFSSFDQGPLADQPAFVPADSPVSPVSPVSSKITEQPAGRDIETPTNPPAKTELSSMSPHDRWAQIRKTAAERAAAFDEAPSRTSQAERTDDGDTSGEETIESRVARIKARVAELTGNMEAAR
ncbi:Morphogenesis protein (Msb1) [Rasamsonia emersonii CBS 393.64]|uniref:Morphogenesis protein (Msb1) n=1 Tax=Rasamsonia emersonii (strain ATCC 16479 / CBS 393.64 / IMI 116815) TaxID=1408163 RepID=A0A0F4Z4Z4_RASE3|nr:Morphogenesis protein (Msb1) [Rasamsonia emersonii CBS 393.64]KKA25592.1 Morphogenesis protein (Msb1) [Rasamsonia emersonii CBS 393.64]